MRMRKRAVPARGMSCTTHAQTRTSRRGNSYAGRLRILYRLRAMASSATKCVVESLADQCQHYIAMHLEKFPTNHLSLLPLRTREVLLWRLPIADACLLENTEFAKGIRDMAEYWKHPYGDFTGTQENSHDFDVAHYFE